MPQTASEITETLTSQHAIEEKVALYVASVEKIKKSGIMKQLRNLGYHLQNIDVLKEGHVSLNVVYRASDRKETNDVT